MTSIATAAQPVLPKIDLGKKWPIGLGLLIIHVGALFGPMTFNWNAFWLFFVMQWITGGLGICLCFHRILTHRSAKVPKWLEYILTLFGTWAVQGGPIKWVSTHRVHHAFSDRPQDPHTPNRGFWWAHILWLIAYDDVIDHPMKYWRYAPELAKDRGHLLIEKTHTLQQILLGVVFFLWGGWSFVVWGIFVRAVLVYHSTWLVNSASHMWGYQNFDTNEGSRNNWFVAVLTYGEGWHNNHHAYPYSARHGLRWWEIDLTYMTIRGLQMLGLATDIRMPQGEPAWLNPPEAYVLPPVPRPIPGIAMPVEAGGVPA